MALETFDAERGPVEQMVGQIRKGAGRGQLFTDTRHIGVARIPTCSTPTTDAVAAEVERGRRLGFVVRLDELEVDVPHLPVR